MGTILFPGSLSPEQKREEKGGGTQRELVGGRIATAVIHSEYADFLESLLPLLDNVGLPSLVLPRVFESSSHKITEVVRGHAGPLSFDSENEICSLERMCRTTSWVCVTVPLLSYLCVEISSARVV